MNPFAKSSAVIRARHVRVWALRSAALLFTFSVCLCGGVCAESVTTQNSLSHAQKEKVDVATRIQNAKLLYETGKYDRAEVILFDIIKADPSNRRAAYYLDLIKEARFAANRRNGLHLWNSDGPYAIQQFYVMPIPNAKVMAGTNFSYTTESRREILAALERIRFNEFSVNLPLKEVLKELSVESRKRDPSGKGINFLINPHPESVPAAVATDARADIESVRIKIDPPLRDLNLANLLDAVSKCASAPIKYRIEDYAVVFSPKAR